MKILVSQESFSFLLSKVQSILDRKSTRPILENVLLEAFDGKLRISATDLRVSLCLETPCHVEKPGAVSIPGRKIYEIVRQMPKEEISLQTKENHWTTVTCGRSVFHLPGVAAEEYPTFPSAPEEFLSVNSSLLRRMLDKTLFAASNDESRIYLCGVFIKSYTDDSNKQQLRMVATDGHRLSLAEESIDSDLVPFNDGVIVPKKGLSELKSIIGEDLEDLQIAASEGRIFAKVDGVDLAITLIDASFPNYNQVIPDISPELIKVRREELSNALRRVSILSDQETHTVVMETKENSVILSSTNPNLGDAREEIEGEYSAEPIRIAFNSVYLLEAVRSMEGEFLTISITDSLAPCMVRSASDPGHLCVVMPMRID